MRYVILGLFLSSLAFGTVAPSFQAETISGQKISLKDSLKPGRALMVNFWATWCTPCIEEAKHVAEKLQQEPNLPLDVITVNTDTSETAADVKPTARLHKIAFPILLDPKHDIFAKYNPSKTLPFSVLIGPNGNIEATFNGFHEEMFQKVKEVVARATK